MQHRRMYTLFFLCSLVVMPAFADTTPPPSKDKDPKDFLTLIPLKEDEYQYVRENESKDKFDATTYSMSILLRKNNLKIPFAASDSQFAPLEVSGAYWVVLEKILLL
jgi:hypothetical protein